jgi:hypothetical protein
VPITAATPFKVGRLVIVDRWLDPLTPLLTPFTFGAAIDDNFSIDVKGIT